MTDISLTDRIRSVLDAVGISRAHVVAQLTGDIAGLVEGHSNRLSGVAFVAPARIEPSGFSALGDRLLYIAPEGGTLAKTAARALPQLPDAKRVALVGYEAESWTDLSADRPEIVEHMAQHFAACPAVDQGSGSEDSGEVAGIRYRTLGSGPTLVLTPMALAPSQWEPIIPALAERFRLVVLSGPKLGMLALLEERAALAGWRQMCAGLFDDLSLSPGNHVLDNGCGSGAIALQFRTHTSGQNPLTAMDLSPYLLGEARISAQAAGMASDIDFQHGSAEALPFADNTFDAAYTVTVFEECNAATGLSELMRVVKPGGRVAVVVRGIDLHGWWNMELPPAIRAKVSLPAGSVSLGGVATAALYDICREAGLKPLRQYPYIVASESTTGPVFEHPETHALSLLQPDEQQVFHASRAKALAAGTLFMTRGHHCFVGEVPSCEIR
jgi:SAM-dependent methyltransferase